MLINFVDQTDVVNHYTTCPTDLSAVCCDRKTVKAALVLLPLLGANNILAITGPFAMTPVHYGLWAIASFSLTGFQGLLFSILYCFSNSDVRRRIIYLIISLCAVRLVSVYDVTFRCLYVPGSCVILYADVNCAVCLWS